MYYVYLFVNDEKEVIYIGQTSDLNERLKYHFSTQGHLPLVCYNETKEVYVKQYNDAYDAALAEFCLIQLNPTPYNKQYNDKYRPGMSYPTLNKKDFEDFILLNRSKFTF